MFRELELKEGWVTVALLLLMLLCVSWSLQSAEWTSGLAILQAVTLAGGIFGIIVAKSRVPSTLAHLLSLLAGFTWTAYLTSRVLASNMGLSGEAALIELEARFQEWLFVMFSGGTSAGSYVFLFFLALLMWLVAYISAWAIFRWQRAWWAVIICGVVLLLNISAAPNNLTGYMIAFVLFALLLVVRASLAEYEEEWRVARVGYSPELVYGFLRAGLAIILIAILLAWVAPGALASKPVQEAWDKVSEPWRRLQDQSSRMFQDLNYRNEPAFVSFTRSMSFGGPVHLSDAPVMDVEAIKGRYWRVMVFHDYISTGWKNTDTDTILLDENIERLHNSGYDLRSEITQTVTLRQDLGAQGKIAAAGQPQRVALPLRAVVSLMPPQLEATADPDASPLPNAPGEATADPEASPLPNVPGEATADPDASPLANAPGEATADPDASPLANAPGEATADSDASPLANAPGEATEEPAPSPLASALGDPSVLYSRQPLKAGDSYQVVSSMTKADAESLRRAGTDYPEWVTRYLQLPESLPERVTLLAEQITAGREIPYDMAVAIERYLRDIPYNQQIEAPALDQDGVDYFLFEVREGYCQYYSSAMVVMLRAMGIPARYVEGYGQGQKVEGAYQILESDGHAWPEVYFPGYGWIEFEPTAGEPILLRPGSQNDDPEGGVDPRDRIRSLRELGITIDDPFPEGGPGAWATPTPEPFLQRVGRWGGLFLAVVAGLLVLAALLMVRRRRRIEGLSVSERVYADMTNWVRRLLGLRPLAHQTPHEYAGSVAWLVPRGRAPIERIADFYVEERFGAKSVDGEEVEGAWRETWPLLWRRWVRRQGEHVGNLRYKLVKGPPPDAIWKGMDDLEV